MVLVASVQCLVSDQEKILDRGNRLASAPLQGLVNWEVREVQRPLNQKVGSKLSGTVDFALRFVIIIGSMNFKFRIY
jgi:hypothetical protein